ncbi:MAG: phosphoribosyltransferase family protein [Desulfobacterales bacterium]
MPPGTKVKFYPDLIVGIARSGLIAAGYLSKQLTEDPEIPVISLWRKRDTVDYQNLFNHISFDRREFNLSAKDRIKILIVDAFCLTGDTLKLAKDFIEKSIGSEDVLIKTAAVIFRITIRDRDIKRPDYLGIERKKELYAFGEKE